jgi:dTDP-4-amino-4,6-dideoxygalactose transaminase
VEGFEEEFAAWHGVPHAVAVNSAAAALFAAVSCAGITGEVLVPSFTWAATANTIVAAGAVPVWVDIEEDTLAIGPEAVAAAIGPRTEAVMPVHYAGHPARTAELAALCEQHGLLLIEDAAEAAGARQNGAPVGSFGVGCFSFYGTKNMTTGGEGGMVTTRDARLAAAIKTLRAHGMRPVPGSKYPWQKEAIVPGFNFRMPEPLAAAGRRQLERLEGMNDARRAVAAQYDLALEEALGDRVRPQRELPGFHHVYHMYVARLRDASVRNEAVARLRETGIEASVHFDPPVHRHDFYRSRYPIPAAGLDITDAVANSVVTLPLSTVMPQSQVRRVVAGLVRVLDELGAK